MTRTIRLRSVAFARFHFTANPMNLATIHENNKLNDRTHAVCAIDRRQPKYRTNQKKNPHEK